MNSPADTLLGRRLSEMGVDPEGSPPPPESSLTIFQSMRHSTARRFVTEAWQALQKLTRATAVAPEFLDSPISFEAMCRCLRSFEFDAPDESRFEAMLRLFAGLAAGWEPEREATRDLELLRVGGSLRRAEWRAFFSLLPLNEDWVLDTVHSGRGGVDPGQVIIRDEREAVIRHLLDVLDSESYELSVSLLEALMDRELINGGGSRDPKKPRSPGRAQGHGLRHEYLTRTGQELLALYERGRLALDGETEGPRRVSFGDMGWMRPRLPVPADSRRRLENRGGVRVTRAHLRDF